MKRKWWSEQYFVRRADLGVALAIARDRAHADHPETARSAVMTIGARGRYGKAASGMLAYGWDVTVAGKPGAQA